MKLIIVLFATGFVLGGGDAARLRRQFGDQFGNQFFPQNQPQNNFGNGFDVFGPFTFPDGNQFQGNQVGQGGNQGGNQGSNQGGNWNQGPPLPPRTTPPNNQNNQQTTRATARPTVATTLAPAVVECSEACNARTTPQYNPVCGTDGVNYHNEARLDCARECGVGVQRQNAGVCRTTT